MFATTPIGSTEYYYQIELNANPVIEQAILEMDRNIDCLVFKKATTMRQSAERSTLYIAVVPRLSGQTVGQYLEEPNTILLATNYFDNTPIEDMMLYKITLHELAHWLGMPAHPTKDNRTSLLGPQMIQSSENKLYYLDRQYLNRMVCSKK